MANNDEFEQFVEDASVRDLLAGETAFPEATQGQHVTPAARVEQSSSTTEVPHLQLIQTVNALIQQNAQLLSMLNLHQPRPSSVSPSANSSDVLNFNVMPDLSKSIDKFNGEEGPSSAISWLQQLENTAALHHWPEAFTLQTAKSHLTGAAKFWFSSRAAAITTFPQFKDAFSSTFVFPESKTECWHNMQARVQRPKENLSTYFHEKMAMCKKLELSFEECKEQVVIGLFSRELANFAVSKTHYNEDHLFQDLVNFQRINVARAERERPRQFEKANSESKSASAPISETSARRAESQPPAPTSRRCFNCFSSRHGTTRCPKPQREPGSCFRCGGMDHQLKNCPQNLQKPSSKDPVALVEEKSRPFVAAYLIDVEFQKLSLSVTSVVDSGSPVSLLIENRIFEPFVKPYVRESNDALTGLNNSLLRIKGIIEDQVKIDNNIFDMKFYVVEKGTMNSTCLLGRDFINHSKIDKIIFGKNNVDIVCNPHLPMNEVLLVDTVADKPSNSLDINECLPFQVQSEINNIFEVHYINAKRPNEPETKFKMSLKLNKLEPFSCRPRRLSYSEKMHLDKILFDLLAKGFIRESSSSFCSPVVLTKKKTGEYRMCVDYRTLNKYIIRDQFPMPLIDDHLDNLRGKKYFTKLDLRNAFHHVVIDDKSIQYTSFITPSGQFEFCRMPFGLSTSPATFTRFINTIFKDLIRNKSVLIYLDDIMIATTTIEENLSILKTVFERLTNNLLELRLDKCSFLKETTDFLGYAITSQGIQPNLDNIRAIISYPIPSNSKQLHSFIGLISYFRRFIQDFSILAKSLYDLLKKNAKYEFTKVHLDAFEILKSKLVAQPILSIYSPFAETELHCDASSIGFGAILLQRQDDNKFHPIFFFSKRTSEAESKYHSYELECLAVVYALKRFHIYLQGIRFKIITDCDSFRLTLAKRDIIPRIMRWCLLLQNYDYSIEHRSNTRMRHVDALSRAPQILILEGNTFEQNLALQQNLDPEIIEIKSKLETTELPLFELRNGLVYRKNDKRLLFYVPKNMQHSILHTYHNEMGHCGVDKTLELISRSYWFPKIKQRIKDYINVCLKCLEYNSKSGKKEGFLHSIPKGTLPFECLHIDHYGPLPTTRTKRRYVFEIIDGFSKFVKLYPCKSTSTQEVITHLKLYFQCYSKPAKIVSDRGSCFTSQIFVDFLKENSIMHVLIATGAPRANGQIERINRSLTPMLAKMVDAQKLSWDNILNDIEFYLNNTVNRSIGETPSRMLFGRNQLGKVNDNLRIYLESELKGHEVLSEIREQAIEKQQKAQIINETYYNSKHKKAVHYKVGDYVMLANTDCTPGVNKKLIPKFRGPYEIVKVLPNDRYVLNDIIGFQQTQIPYDGVVEASRLKSYAN